MKKTLTIISAILFCIALLVACWLYWDNAVFQIVFFLASIPMTIYAWIATRGKTQ